MTIILDIDPATEKQLRSSSRDLMSEAKEALLVEFYRQERLTRPQLAKALGLSRLELDDVLKRHQVIQDMPSVEELELDLQQARVLVKG